MASGTDLERNEDSDLVLSWSGRWTLSYRILAVNVLTIVLIALAVLYLDAYRNRLEKERLRQVIEEVGLAATAVDAVPAVKREALLASLSRSTESRLRLYSDDGRLLLDCRTLRDGKIVGIVSQADTSGSTCDVIKKAFPKKRGATFGDAARSAPQDRFDQTLGGLVEARR